MFTGALGSVPLGISGLPGVIGPVYEGELSFGISERAKRLLAVCREEVKSGVVTEVVWDKNLYVGVKGLKLVLETGESLASCKDAGIYALDPTGVVKIWLADEFRGSRIVYYLREDDIDIAGLWQIQSFVDFGSWKAFGEKIIIPVEDSLR